MYLVPSKILHVTETSLVVQGLDHSQCKGSFWIVVLGKALESPLDWKEIEPVNPKGNQPWIFVGRINAETEAPLLWLPDAKSWLNRENPDAGEGWRQKKGTGEDEMVGWHHWLNGHEFEQTQGDSEGQRSLAYCSPWGCKESDMIERLNNNYCYTQIFNCFEGWHPNLHIVQLYFKTLDLSIFPWSSVSWCFMLMNFVCMFIYFFYFFIEL